MAETEAFDDVLVANRRYAESFALQGLSAPAARRLAVLTCIDSRIEPLAMLGLRPGDAKILRNAGGRVTPEVLTTLVVAHHLLDVERLMVIAHSDCRMAGGSEDDLHRAIREAGGPDTRSLTFAVTDDQPAALRCDVGRLRASPYLQGLAVGGFLYNVETGLVDRVV